MPTNLRSSGADVFSRGEVHIEPYLLVCHDGGGAVPSTPIKSILLIDDEIDVREIMQTCLQDIGGWRVIAFTSVREGLSLFLGERPDLILLDASTAEADGFLFFEQLKQFSSSFSVPIILISGRTNWFTPQQLLQMGFAGVIPKPFDPKLIATQITNLLGWNQTDTSADEH